MCFDLKVQISFKLVRVLWNQVLNYSMSGVSRWTIIKKLAQWVFVAFTTDLLKRSGLCSWKRQFTVTTAPLCAITQMMVTMVISYAVRKLCVQIRTGLPHSLRTCLGSQSLDMFLHRPRVFTLFRFFLSWPVKTLIESVRFIGSWLLWLWRDRELLQLFIFKIFVYSSRKYLRLPVATCWFF